MTPPHLSAHREMEAAKEAVALKTIRHCADWLRERGEPALANQLLADMIEDEANHE